MDQVNLIERSLRCFVFGLLGLVPVLGLPAAIIALQLFRKVTADGRGQWNPASRYLYVGGILGLLTLLLWTLAFAALLIWMVSSLG